MCYFIELDYLAVQNNQSDFSMILTSLDLFPILFYFACTIHGTKGIHYIYICSLINLRHMVEKLKLNLSLHVYFCISLLLFEFSIKHLKRALVQWFLSVLLVHALIIFYIYRLLWTTYMHKYIKVHNLDARFTSSYF